MKAARAIVALGLTGVSTLGIAAAHALGTDGPSTQTVQAQWSGDSWYQTDPTCQTPVGCVSLPLPATNPYGAGTLHVAVTGGQEAARSYLTVKAQTPPDGYQLTGATFSVPLDTATSLNGSMSPDTSKVQVCTSTAAAGTDEGSFATPPVTSCAEYAELTYNAGTTPTLTGDLSPILDILQQQLPTGKLSLALLPVGPAATNAWNDVFSSITRTSPPTPVAALTLTYTATSASSTPTPAATTPAAVVTQAAAPPPTVATGTGTAPIAPAPADTAPAVTGNIPAPAAVVPSEATTVNSAAPPVVADQPATVDTVPAAATATQTVQVGFLYPAVLLLPAILLIASYLIINLMTRDLAPTKR